jgi:hypothetical protein
VANVPVDARRGFILKLELFCGTLALGPTDVGMRPEIVALTRNGQALPIKTLDLNLDDRDHHNRLFRFADGAWVYGLNAKSLGPGSYVVTIQMPDGRRFAASFLSK